jgi:DNA-binding MarR family transcriptional regulator
MAGFIGVGIDDLGQFPRSSRTLSRLSLAALHILILEGKPMHSRHLAERLKVDQHYVYQVMKILVERRLVAQGTVKQRIFYTAYPKALAYVSYISNARREFERLFADVYAKSRAPRFRSQSDIGLRAP